MRVEGNSAAALAALESARPAPPAPHLSTAQPAVAAAPSQAPARKPEEEQVRRAEPAPEVESTAVSSRSRIRVDEESKRFIVQVLNANNDVIKQFPPDEILRFSARFRKLQGLLFDETA